jgi:4-diphosphocytidyl-2-C-methyl-D-erythritol kinase
MSLCALFDLPAPAKLNLFLHLIGRRADGYHLLQSVFVLIDWADRLHLERRDDGRLQRHDLGPALPADDLCLRAARALQQASGCTLGADISIAKRVPWGAGLGGGSSDAATTLLGLNRLWRLHWPRERLLRLGATLGADVPFFIGGHNAFVEGIGERLTPLTLPRAGYAVLKPAASLPTAAIFASPLLKRDTQAVILAGSFADTDALSSEVGGRRFRASMCADGFGRNDLQAAAIDHCHEVAQAAEWLQARYGNSRMTGSGSAVFARVSENVNESGPGDQPGATFPAATDAIGLPPGWVGRLCHSLNRHPLADWSA